jgi:predicted regulator of Ras-like GTPase activity (Roadblock/LC7/MglB family)
MGDIVLTGSVLNQVKEMVDSTLISAGVHTALVIDDAGNIVANCGEGKSGFDLLSLAALAAANFGATSQMAKLIGEDDFSLLFHKGKSESIHFSRIGDEFILISIFSDDVSLGLVRLRVAQLSKTIAEIFDNRD